MIAAPHPRSTFLSDQFSSDVLSRKTTVGVTGPATFGQDSGPQQAGSVAIRVDGVWQTIDSTGYGASGSLGSLLAPVHFAGGEVDAIQLTDADMFGDQQNATTCTFFGGCFQKLDLGFAFDEAAPPPPLMGISPDRPRSLSSEAACLVWPLRSVDGVVCRGESAVDGAEAGGGQRGD